MATKNNVLDRKKESSDKISAQVRTLGVGILALTWGLLASDSAIAKQMATTLRMPLLRAGTLAVLVILLDYMQYFFAHEVARLLLNQMERDGLNEGQYNYKSWPYRLMYWLFYGKQALLLLVTVYLLCNIGWFVVVRK